MSSYISYTVNFTGGYGIRKAVFPYTEDVMHEFDQGIGEITDFKLIHEYIFAIVRDFHFVVFNLVCNLFAEKF